MILCSDLSSFFLCHCKKCGKGIKEAKPQYFEDVRCTDIKSKLKLILQFSLCEDIQTSSLPTCWHCGVHPQHLPSAQCEHRWMRTYWWKKKKKKEKERTVIYYSSISRASLPLTVSSLATDTIYHLTVQFRYI